MENIGQLHLLDKVCPKDNYQLPNVDKLIDSMTGHELLNFIDHFLGYSQIPLAEEH